MLLLFLRSIFKKREYLYTVTVVISCLLLSLLSSNFQLFVALLFVIFVVIYAIVNDFFYSVFTLFLMTAQFQLPGKYYIFELVPRNLFSYPSLQDGLFDGYGLVSSDIVAFVIVLFFLKNGLNAILTGTISSSLKTVNNSFLKLIHLCWLIYFGFSQYSSSTFSFYPAFSTILLIQYSKMVVMFWASYYLFNSNKQQYRTLFFYLMSSLIVFQSYLGFQQLLGRISQTSSPVSLIVAAEEQSLIPRINGSFEYANQFGLIILIFVLLIAPKIKRKSLNFINISFFLACFDIVFSKSRTIWIAALGIVFLLILRHPKQRIALIARAVRSKFILLLLSIPLIIILNRLLSSTATFDVYGGGALRLEMLKEGVTQLQAMPLAGFMGYGIETNVKLLFDEIPNGYIRYFPFAIHNGFLQMTLESGLVATLFFFIPFYVVLRRLILKYLHKDFSLNLPFSAGLGLIALIIYYCVQPINARVEFIFIGLLFGTFSLLYKPNGSKYRKI